MKPEDKQSKPGATLYIPAAASMCEFIEIQGRSNTVDFSRGGLYTLRTLNRLPMTGRVNAVVTERPQFDIKWEVMNEMSLKSREEFSILF